MRDKLLRNFFTTRVEPRLKGFYWRLKGERRVRLPYLEAHVCDHCNLNCKACSHFCPLVENAVFTDAAGFARDIHIVAEKIAFGWIRLLGGEPLLHPHLPEFMAAARHAYPDAAISVVTNGLLLPAMKDVFWEACLRHRVAIDLSKYPPTRERFSEYLDMIDDHGVQLGGIALARRFLVYLRPEPEVDEKAAYALCADKTCINLYGGRLYPCPSACFRPLYNARFNARLLTHPGLDIRTMTPREIRQTFLQPFAACRHCDFAHARHIPWEQSGRAGEEWLLPRDSA